MHEEFSPVSGNNDIALIRVSESFEINPYVEPIALITAPEGELNFEGQMVTASGWGKTSDYSGNSNQLRFVEMTVENQDICKSAYGPGTVNDGVICANTQYGTKSTCQGDSGGPLVLFSGRLVGVTSFVSKAGCQSGYPVAFSRVSYYLNWISDYTGI